MNYKIMFRRSENKYLKFLGSILCKAVDALFVFLKFVQESCDLLDKFFVVHTHWISQTD